MKKAKILLVGIILILVKVPEVKAIWDNYEYYSYNTWRGSSITFDNGSVSINLGKEHIQSPSKWYYYKGNIIGIFKWNQFFVLNEKTKSAARFENIDEWETYLKNENLVPKLYTRWYSDHIGDYNSTEEFFLALILISLLCPPVALVLISLLIWGIFRLLKRVFFIEQINFKRPGTLFLSILILFPLLRIFWIDWFVFSF